MPLTIRSFLIPDTGANALLGKKHTLVRIRLGEGDRYERGVAIFFKPLIASPKFVVGKALAKSVKTIKRQVITAVAGG